MKKNSSIEKNVIRRIKPINRIGKKAGVNSDLLRKRFPIVVIGASAGGLEAYTALLKNLSTDTGMAYIIIQHLSPDYKSMLTDILRRETKLEALTITKGMKPLPDKIYVTPPTSSVSINEGVFHLSPRVRGKKSFMPIDIFMRSLAEDNRHFAIGVILSGTGSDGVLGMEFIKTSGGITYTQDSRSAKFFEMPKNSISAGVVDFVLSPEAIARELIRISKNVYLGVKDYLAHDEVLLDSDNEISKILNMLRIRKNIDFRLYKPTTVRRRILRRMLMHKINYIQDYIKFVTGNYEEIDALCEDILINVSSFFRDPEMYESLKKNVFPKLVKNRAAGDQIRIWIAACSTGQESYSMAIALAEFLGNKLNFFKIQIFSTDLSDTGIEKARSGIYSKDIVKDVSEKRLKKFFASDNGSYRVNKNIRDLCVFAKQNLLQDAPFGKVDLISCRNVLIYLSSILHNKIFPIFHYALNQAGYLVLGTSETVSTHKNLFDLIDRKNRIYKKSPFIPNTVLDYNMSEVFGKAIANSNIAPIPGHHLREQKIEAESFGLMKYAPHGIVINKNMEVIEFRGNPEKYLKMDRKVSTNNIFKMVDGRISHGLKNLINESIKKNKTARKNNFHLNHEGKSENINIIVEPLKDSLTSKNAYLILFEDNFNEELPGKIALNHKNISKETNETLHIVQGGEFSKEHLQSVIAQHESTNEELRAANEEIQSTNEELQSTNEELETTKEELQSTNEELTTVNEELQNRYTELNSVNSDLNNLLGSIKISIVIVDNDLTIRRFTNESYKLLNLIPTDIGRKITDINSNLEITNLNSLIRSVIETPQIKEVEVKDNGECWYSMRIRPYKTLENKIDGVIITFIDITEIKESMKLQDIHRKEVEILNVGLEDRVKERTVELAIINKNLQLEVIERKNMENSLRILSQNLIGAQETERLKLSRELHDSVNQILTIAKLRAYATEEWIKKVVKNKANLKHISDTKKYIEKAIDEIRRLSHSLRPSSLADIGIIAAIKSIIDEFKDRTNINVDFSKSRNQKRFTEEIELTLYRIVQEALQNIEKHSKATNVKININQNKNYIQLSVSDNGRGFIRAKTVPRNKELQQLGLLGIKERTESVGGKILIKTELGLGTLIEVTIPVNFKKNAEQAQKNKDLTGGRSSAGKARHKGRTKKK